MWCFKALLFLRIDTVEHGIEPSLVPTTSLNFPLSRSDPILKQKSQKNQLILINLYTLSINLFLNFTREIFSPLPLE